MIYEKGFNLGGPRFDELNKEIGVRGWKKFCAPPKGYCEELIKEFYSNLNPYDEEDTVWVKGAKIPYDGQTINNY